ncbi:MAG: hypothetical protein OXG04_23750 [Acidobacteria bacterium]|nr:hypothetical protein [Acidobacteriota bacterium]
MDSQVLAQWAQIAIGVVSVLAALVGIAGALIAVFWRGVTLTNTITEKITESENRLRSENREAHAAIGTNIKRLGDQLGTTLNRLTTDVAVLRGRQEERDQRGG